LALSFSLLTRHLFMGPAPLFALLLSYVSYRLAERVIQQQVRLLF
jgi:hypothetical protein